MYQLIKVYDTFQKFLIYIYPLLSKGKFLSCLVHKLSYGKVLHIVVCCFLYLAYAQSVQRLLIRVPLEVRLDRLYIYTHTSLDIRSVHVLVFVYPFVMNFFLVFDVRYEDEIPLITDFFHSILTVIIFHIECTFFSYLCRISDDMIIILFLYTIRYVICSQNKHEVEFNMNSTQSFITKLIWTPTLHV